MKIVLASALLSTLLLTPVAAGERLGDGAMGALAGGLVAGPVGLVAGGVIGYTGGPHISRAMGINKPHRRRVRHVYYRN